MAATRTRYFVIVSLLVLVVGLGTGLVAYYVGFPVGAASAGGPDELRLIPRDASLVAYADVRAVMVSEVRQRLLQVLPLSSDGQHQFEDQTGINIDTDVDRLVACLTAPAGAQGLPLAGMALVRGRFNETKIEALMRSHGAQVESYKDARLLVADVRTGQAGTSSMSLAFVEPGLVAVGSTALIRGAVDLKSGGDNITANEEVMNFVKSFSIDNAWAVGRFDALTAEAKLPPSVATQIPPITWFAAGGRVDSGISGTFRADARDDESATNLRDMFRGIIAFARLQANARPELRSMLDSLQLGGAGKTVTLAFDVSPQMFDQLASALKGLHGAPVTPSK